MPRNSSPSSKHHTLHGSEIVELPTLLQNLCDANRSGTLVVKGKGKTAFFCLRLGALAAAFDGDPHQLGKALVKTRALEWSDLTAFTEFARPTPATLEHLLVEHGRVDAGAIQTAHVFSIREVLSDVVTWHESHTRLLEVTPPELLALNLPNDHVSLPTKPALMEAVYQQDEWPRIRAAIPSDRDVLQVFGTPPKGSDAAAELIGLINGVRDVAEVVGRARMSRFDAMLALLELVEGGTLARMDAAGLLDVAEQLLASSGPEAARSKLIQVYLRAEELGHTSPDTTRWLAEAYEAQSDVLRASTRYLGLGRALLKTGGSQNEATRLFKKALELRPGDSSLQRELILALIGQGCLEDAALQTEVYVEWLREQGDPALAVRSASPILDQLGEFEEMLVLRAELCLDVGNTLQATRIYEQIAEDRLSSDDFDQDEKADALERILEIDPSNLNARFMLANLLEELDPTRAVSEAREFIVQSGAKPEQVSTEHLVEIYELLARLDSKASVVGPLARNLLASHKVAQAETLLRDALTDEETTIGEDAIPAFEELFANTGESSAHLMLSKALLRAGLITRGVAELRVLAARAIAKGSTELALEAYQTALDKNRFDRTIRMALGGLLKGPENRRARLENMRALAHIAQVEGNLDLAVRTLDDLRREVPGDPTVLVQLVDCQLRRNGPQVLDELRRFVVESRKRDNRAHVTWGIRRAQAMKAPPEWFEGLPKISPRSTGRRPKPAPPRGPAE